VSVPEILWKVWKDERQLMELAEVDGQLVFRVVVDIGEGRRQTTFFPLTAEQAESLRKALE
jgi:hypothetical protein